MTNAQIFETIGWLAEETGMPSEQLMQMRPSELKPLTQFARIKIRKRIEASEAEVARLEAEEQEWLDMHPLWRAHLEEKRER